MRSQLRPLLLLALFSPLVAEFLLGDQYLSGSVDFALQAGMLLSFVAFYGMAAVLLREVARRLRMGWPGLLLLALAFGIFEEGLITQTLFNPHYLGLDLLAPGHIDALGIGAPWTLFVLSLHVIWSIATPIAIIEAWRGTDGAADLRPWLGRVGIAVCLIIFILGAAAIGLTSTVFAQQPFLAQPAQLITAGLLVLAVGLAAVLLGRRIPNSAVGARPHPSGLQPLITAMIFGLIATSGFQAVAQPQDRFGWWSAFGIVVVWAVGSWFMITRRPEPFGVAVGAVLTYAWVGMLPAIRVGAGAIVEQSVLIIVMLSFVGWSGARLLRPAGQPARPGRSPIRG